MSELLLTKIAAVRRKQSTLAAGRALAALAGLAVLLLAVGMLLDYWIELPRWARAVILTIDLAVLGYVLFRYVLHPLFFGPDDDDVALMVERATPEFRTRLIASVQLSRPGSITPGSSPSLVEALVRQTEAMAGPMDFTQVVKAEQFLRTAVLAVLVVLTGAVTALYAREVSADLLRRAFLANTPVPRDTSVEVLTKDQTIAIGQGINLQAVAHGVVPGEGRVDIKYASGRSQTFIMDRAKDPPATQPVGTVSEVAPEPSSPHVVFERAIENVQESFTYVVRLNDGHSERFRVDAHPRPVVTSLDLSQEFPAYTGRRAEKRSPGDLSLLVGSKLMIKARSSKPLRAGAIKLVALDEEVQMVVGGQEAAGTIEVPPKDLTGFSVRLIDETGIESKNETVYPVDLITDKEPTIRITRPDRKEELATQQAKLLMDFQAGDDFGIAKLVMHYKVEGQGTGDEKTFELDLEPVQGGRRLLTLNYLLDLAKLRPMPLEGSAVEYWLEVQDANDVTGPGKTFSEHYRAKIVSEVEKRADLANRLNDQLGTIDFVTQDQEKLNQNLGTLIFEKK